MGGLAGGSDVQRASKAPPVGDFRRRRAVLRRDGCRHAQADGQGGGRTPERRPPARPKGLAHAGAITAINVDPVGSLPSNRKE
eukprot:scaffold679686_cov47-Prasinocladus_malaysianus.AAC.1